MWQDVGTDNEGLSNDPLYLGNPYARVGDRAPEINVGAGISVRYPGTCHSGLRRLGFHDWRTEDRLDNFLGLAPGVCRSQGDERGRGEEDAAGE
jgi:hypothetical protein